MPVFDQRNQTVTYQYNAAGDINFGAVHNRADLVRELEKLTTEVRKARQAEIIDLDTSTDAEYQLTKAVQQAQKPAADKQTILDHLKNASTLIAEATGGVTAVGGLLTALHKAAELAQSMF